MSTKKTLKWIPAHALSTMTVSMTKISMKYTRKLNSFTSKLRSLPIGVRNMRAAARITSVMVTTIATKTTAAMLLNSLI